MPTRLIDSTPPPIVDLVLARHDLRRGDVDGLEARGAEAVDLHARHALGIARDERRGAGDVAALLADRMTQPSTTSSTSFGVELVAVA